MFGGVRSSNLLLILAALVFGALLMQWRWSRKFGVCESAEDFHAKIRGTAVSPTLPFHERQSTARSLDLGGRRDRVPAGSEKASQSVVWDA